MVVALVSIETSVMVVTIVTTILTIVSIVTIVAMLTIEIVVTVVTIETRVTVVTIVTIVTSINTIVNILSIVSIVAIVIVGWRVDGLQLARADRAATRRVAAHMFHSQQQCAPPRASRCAFGAVHMYCLVDGEWVMCNWFRWIVPRRASRRTCFIHSNKALFVGRVVGRARARDQRTAELSWGYPSLSLVARARDQQHNRTPFNV